MKQGFTLIELLVVMAIIGLLTSVLVPNLSKAQERAKETAVKAVMHNVQAELEGYFIDNNFYPEGEQTLAELTTGMALKNSYKNPFTGSNYTSSDKSGQIMYFNDESGYKLTSYKKDGTTELLVLTNN